ncbi:MAG TPA: hypothetical protein VNM91_01340 [Dehalococcoidia bacterium]|nr:hypothetical protein [Dehalococcoidia bacterium]
MTTANPAKNVTPLEDLRAVRWLQDALAPARARLREAPTPEALARIRERVLGDTATRKRERSIAA